MNQVMLSLDSSAGELAFGRFREQAKKKYGQSAAKSTAGRVMQTDFFFSSIYQTRTHRPNVLLE
jgi:hypothetical protein